MEAPNNFQEYWYNYLFSLFEFLSTSSDIDDLILKEISTLENPPSNSFCSNCNKNYFNQKCDDYVCSIVSKANLVEDNEPSSFSCKGIPKYFGVGEVNIPNHVNISMGEPALVTPNSFKNLETTLEQLHENATKKSEREWLFVGADGPPYCLMTRLPEKKPFDYDWVSLVSGDGHLNMNLLETFFKITEKIILEPLGKEILKYNTQKSFYYFINCKDNHKAWQAFDIFLNGTVMELIRMYCAEEINTPTPIRFLNW